MLRPPSLTLIVALGCLSACSGESSSDGSGGSSSAGGGASGAGGTASGGVAGSGGGVAGSASGGSSAGGSGGTGGSTGGAAGSSAGGSGGSTAGNPGCQPLCDAIVGASCTDGPTLKGCLLTCKALTSASSCDPTAQKYFDCVKTAGVTCNAKGEPVATGCGLDYLKAIDCATSANPNPAIVAPCSTYCDKVVAKGCALNGTKDECNSNCKWLGATGTGCDDEWSAYLTCANAASFVCLLGYASPVGCGTAFTAYTKCVNAAGSP